MFHVWSTSLVGGPDAWIFDGAVFPQTEAAQAARAGYDMYGNPIIGTCIAKGMPTIMEQPYPMEFEQGDGVIYLRMEEGAIVREIHMGAVMAARSEPRRDTSTFLAPPWRRGAAAPA